MPDRDAGAEWIGWCWPTGCVCDIRIVAGWRGGGSRGVLNKAVWWLVLPFLRRRSERRPRPCCLGGAVGVLLCRRGGEGWRAEVLEIAAAALAGGYQWKGGGITTGMGYPCVSRWGRNTLSDEWTVMFARLPASRRRTGPGGGRWASRLRRWRAGWWPRGKCCDRPDIRRSGGCDICACCAAPVLRRPARVVGWLVFIVSAAAVGWILGWVVIIIGG